MNIALVTGASSGLGEEFCHSLDAKGLDCIWMVARRAEALERVADSLKTPTKIIIADLSTKEGVGKVIDELDEESPSIRYLINNAGFGLFGSSWEIPRQKTEEMISLNVTALVSITSACIPHMSSGSKIIEICSESAYVPLKDLAVYSSTKAFVRHYCDALREELKDTGITVTEVSPGWIRTDFIDICVNDKDVPKKVFNHTVSREDVVCDAMRVADKGGKRSTCGLYTRIQIALSNHFRGLAIRVWNGSLKR